MVTVTSRTALGATGIARGTGDGSAPDVAPEVGQLLHALKTESSRQALQAAMGLKDDDHFRKVYLLPAIEERLIEMTRPDKPRSSKQT